MKNTVYIYCHSPMRIKDFLLIADTLKRDYHLIFILENQEHQTYIESKGYQCRFVYKNGNFSFFKKLERRNPKLFSFFNKIKVNSLGQVLAFIVHFIDMSINRAKIRKIFNKDKPNAIILSSDTKPYLFDLSVLSVASDLSVKIILPYLMNAHFSGSLLMLKDNKKYKLDNKSSVVHKLVYSKYKSQMIEGTFYYQPYLYIIMKILKITPVNPWFQGSGVSDLVFLTSQSSFNEHVENGVCEGKLRVIGSPAYLSLMRAYNNKNKILDDTIKKYNLKTNKIIIISLIQLYEHNITDKSTHLGVVKNTIKSVLEQSSGYSIIISLHPMMKKEDYLFIIKDYNLPIIEERLQDILPIAQIFVCGRSTTVEWSVNLGIKTLIIDYIPTNNYYNFLTSTVVVKQEDKISLRLNELMIKEVCFKDDWHSLDRDTLFNKNLSSDYIDNINQLIR